MIYWPISLAPKTVGVNMVPSTTVGPPSLSGLRQGVSSPAGYWSVTYKDIPLLSDSRKLLWRALAAQIEGRSNPICLTVCDLNTLSMFGGMTGGVATFSEGETFSDSGLFSHGPTQVITTTELFKGDTSVDVAVLYGGEIVPGYTFSIGYRMYRVKSVLYLSAGAYRIGFWPMCRDDNPISSEMNFTLPVCKVKLLEDAGMDTDITAYRSSFASVKFMEDAS